MPKLVWDLYHLSPAQKAFYKSKAAHPAFICGFNSGKTYVGCLKALYLSMKNRPLPGMFIEPTFPHVTKTALPMFKQLLRTIAEKPIPYRYNKNDHILTIKPWDSEIWLCSGHDPESIRGPTLAWAGADEIAQMKEEIWGEIVGRVRHADARLRQSFVTGTPDEYWVAEKWQDDPQPGYRLFHSTPFANPAASDEYIAELRRAWSEDDLQRVLWGRFVRGGVGRVYKQFDRATHCKSASPFDPEGKCRIVNSLPLCLCCDFNINPCVWLIAQHRGGEIYFADEIVLRDTTTAEMIAELQERKYNRHPAGLIVYGDPSGKAKSTAASRSDYELMRRAGLTRQDVAKAAPLVKDRVMAWNARLKDGTGKTKLFIHPDCKLLVKDMEWVKWQEGKAALDKSDRALTHASDAGGYFVHRMYPIRRPAPGRTRMASFVKGRRQ